MGRIIANCGLVKYHFYFPKNPNEDLQRFMDQMCQLLKTDSKEDDAADSMCGLAAYLEKYSAMFRYENTN
ncbi:MAG: hypothetical protein IMZ64_01725 [Bacteroidetes bacterium]|nr:hypothetical protein [Bacteroidota bacterium]